MPTVTDPTSRLLATRIRKARAEYPLTLAEVAERIGEVDDAPALSKWQLGKIETCERSVGIPELAVIAEVLGVKVEDLLRAGEVCEACGQEKPR
jgi:transcriptional regulator with XRE-family HTH domain